MRRSPRDILASLYCDVDNYRFLRRRANQSVAVLAKSDICKASYTASQKAESLQRGHITSMLSKFDVRFGALVFWDTFRLGVGGCNWSARGMISFSFQLVTEHWNFACSLQTPKIRLLI